jgi:hypothetical protein
LFLCRHAVSNDTLAIVGPRRTAAEVVMLREMLQPAAIGPDEVNVEQMEALPVAFRGGKIAVPIRGKGDPLTVGRPRRAEVASTAGSQGPGLVRGHVENPEIRCSRGTRRDKHDLFPIR